MIRWPSGRLALILLAVVCYTTVIVVADGVGLPTVEVRGWVQMPANTLDALGSLFGDQVPGSAATSATSQNSSLPSHSGQHLSLPPFGVHRPGINDAWWLLACAVLFGVLTTTLIFLFPRRVRRISAQLETRHASSHAVNFLLGVIVYMVSYVLLRLSWLTVVGMPLILVLTCSLWLVTLFGLVSVSFSTGRTLLRCAGTPLPPLAKMLLGLWLLLVTCLVPYVGWVLAVIASATGLGAVVQSRFGSGRPWSLSALEDPTETTELPDNVVSLRRSR